MTVMVAATYAGVVSLVGGWVLGARVGDERGVIGYTLFTLAILFGIVYLIEH